jgi:hypothetical protein
MSARLPRLLPLFLLTIPLASCSVVGGIFKAGFWTAIIVVVLIVALVGFFARGRRGP